MHKKQLIFIVCWAMMWVIAIVASLMMPVEARAESLFGGIEAARQLFAMISGEIGRLFIV